MADASGNEVIAACDPRLLEFSDDSSSDDDDLLVIAAALDHREK